ncbi:MAG: phosphoheptose isomerase [Acidobacteriota bacterium]|nr:phosphoheptose isomerase [Acidobacteriota bacterium]
MPLRKLEPSFRERPWGTRNLEPWFPNARAEAGPLPIGEVWFETPEIPLLVKFLFAHENLSVQVHPDDKYARLHHSSPGKTEMWHVLKAEPGAKIAAGFREPVTSEQARAGALDGTIMEMLEWFDAQAGDTFFIPAGTVHAIGAGLTICEIQQQSDITYRFFDYGRGRELHLDSALTVSHLGPHDARRAAKVECDYFMTEPLKVEGAITLPPSSGDVLVIAIEGEGEIDGRPMRAGEVWHVRSSETLKLTGNLHLLRTSIGT